MAKHDLKKVILAIRSKDDGKKFSYLITVLSNKTGPLFLESSWCEKHVSDIAPLTVVSTCVPKFGKKYTRRDHKATWVIFLERNYQIQPRSKALPLVCLLIAREIFPPRIVRLFTVHKFSPLLIILHHCLRLLDTVFKVRPRLLYMEKGWPAQPSYPGQANPSIKSWRCESLTSEKKSWLG